MMPAVPFLRSSMNTDEVMHYASLGMLDGGQAEIAAWMEQYIEAQRSRIEENAYDDGVEEGESNLTSRQHDLRRAAEALADFVWKIRDEIPEKHREEATKLISKVEEHT
jgi:hypothetical protein